MRILLLTFLLTITIFAQANVTVYVFAHSICGRPSGIVQANMQGGVPPYTYAWSNGATDAYVEGLMPGIYTVTVTDALNDQYTAQGEVLAQNSYGYSYFTSDLTMQCAGGPAMGWVYLGMDQLGVNPPITHPAYGPSPYSFNHPGLLDAYDVTSCYDPTGITYKLLTFDPLLAGTSPTVSYTDGNGCPGSFVVGLGLPVTWPTVQLVSAQASCQNMNSGSLTFSVNSMNTQWSTSVRWRKDGTTWVCGSEALFNGGQIAEHTLTNLGAGNYWLITTNDVLGFDHIPSVGQNFCRDSVLVTVPLDPIDCGRVVGRLYVDNNSNCVMNTGENRIPNAVLEFTPGPYYATTGSSGYYSITLPLGTYTITEQHPVYAQSCPASVTLTMGAQWSVNVGCAGGQPLDVQMALANGPARPGFDLHYSAQVTNLTDGSTGNTTVTMTLDPLLAYSFATPIPTSVSGNVITWSGNQFVMNQPFQTKSVRVHTTVPSDVTLIGSTLNTQVSVTTQNTDTDPTNNTAASAQIVTGSYDPNDKLARTTTGGGSAYYLDADEWIDYTLRFQNTGTDTAFTVVITDTLPATLDPATLQWGPLSHSGTSSLTGAGVVTFTFSNILLPDSGSNEAASHGFASFRIRPVSGLPVGTTISNEANIFFDFNPPVITDPQVLTTSLMPIRVPMKVFLGGAYDGGTGLMSDQLRADALLPVMEPYTALGYVATGTGPRFVLDGGLFHATGPDAIVDWVILELRNALIPSQVEASRFALVQRDGDVVDLDGVSAPGFETPAGSYYVAVRHRNHLGCMSATALPLSATSGLVNFTAMATNTWGTGARQIRNGTMVLWPGNVHWDDRVKYAGPVNDRDKVLVAIGGTVPTAVINGYATEDVNLNGQISYTGSENDRDPILTTIGGSVFTAVRVEQLP